MATIVHRSSVQLFPQTQPRRVEAVKPTAAPVRRASPSDWSDREAGMAAVAVVAALALVLGLIVVTIVLYSLTQGYWVSLE